jgi:uncharacterized membrane protein
MAQQAELLVIGFPGKHRAAEVLNRLETLNLSFALDLQDAVSVYRTHNGRLRIDKSWEPTTKQGAAWGALLGLISAALLAPFTLGATGAVAATLGLTGAALGADDADTWKRTYGISNGFVKDVGGMVLPGDSAVFVLARASDPAAVAEKFRGYGGHVLRTSLPPEMAAKFDEVMAPVTASTR